MSMMGPEVYLWIQKTWVWILPLLVLALKILAKYPRTPLPYLQRRRKRVEDELSWCVQVKCPCLACVLGSQCMPCSLMPYSDTATINSLWASEATAPLAIIIHVAADTSLSYILCLTNAYLRNECMAGTCRALKQETPVQSGRDSSEELPHLWSLSV